MNAIVQRHLNLGSCFAKAREYDFVHVATCLFDTLQLTSRDDVEARAQARQQIQHSQIGIGLDGITDQTGNIFQGLGIDPVMALEGRPGVDKAGCAELCGDVR